MTYQFAQLIEAMIQYYHGDAKRIQHFIKVHDFAVTIATLEKIDTETQFILEAAAIVHDIGIRNSEKKYGSSSGKYQELEGPSEAEKLLTEVGGFSPDQIDRITYLVGRHHTYNSIEGMDYQILVEADFLVNLYEDEATHHAIDAAGENIFKTRTGTEFLKTMFLQS